MKRFLIVLFLLVCNMVCADTINLRWLNSDGSIYQNSTCTIGTDLIVPSPPPTKYGYTFTGWRMWSYTPIEYLESTGTQWIDTGYPVNDNVSVQMKIMRLRDYSSTSLFGYRFVNHGTAVGNMRFVFVYDDGKIGLRTGVNTTNSTNRLLLNTDYTIDYTLRDVKVNNETWVTSYSEYTTALFGNGYVCTTNTTGYYSGDINGFIGRLYYFKMYDNNTLVRDFIPVLDKDGIPCMLDRVEAKFYYNQGTGDFIAGPVLQ